ncbi:MAG: response regulator [Chloroflexi bacterium]|nr:response regulator [Chloroflexota bacterium]
MNERMNDPIRILVADDEQEILDVYYRILCPPEASREDTELDALGAELFGHAQAHKAARHRYDVTCCRQSSEVVEAVRQAREEGRPYAAVFLDVRMPPGEDGIWAAEQVRALDRDVGIVIVTGHADVQSSDIAHRVPPADRLFYIQKPFHQQELLQFASALSARRQAEEWAGMAHKTLQAQVVEQTVKLARVTETPHGQIAERELIEEALRESEERYRDLLESAHDLIQTVSWDGRFLFVNRAWLDTMGYTEAEVHDLRVSEIIHPDSLDLWQDALAAVVNGDVMQSMQITFVVRNGRPVLVEGNLVPSRRQGYITASHGFFRDVTERRRLEAQFRQAQKMEVIGRLAGGVAHDFNNLLTVISGHCQFLLADLDPSSDMIHDVEGILHASESAANLTRQLLAFSRRQMQQLCLLDLNEVLERMAKMLRRVIGEDVALEMHLGEDLGTVQADPGQLEQVIVNLALNARDAMPDGGKVVLETANVYMDAEEAAALPGMKPGNWVMVAVHDTGCGMSDEVKQHLFEPFFTTKEPGKGTGLGLPTVYGIVKQSQGYVYIDSEASKGTTVRIYLPRVDMGAEDIMLDRPAAELPRGTERILLVEDADDVRRLTVRMLHRLGYRVLAASNASDALALFSSASEVVDLVLTDILMPQTSGGVLVKQLRRIAPGTKVLYMSGYSNEVIDPALLRQPGTGFIAKPFTVETLAQKLREVLQGDPAGVLTG